MLIKTKGVGKCKFYAKSKKVCFSCKKCGVPWWTAQSGQFRCSCGKSMVITLIEPIMIRAPAKSSKNLLFYNNDPTWKKSIKGYLGG